VVVENIYTHIARGEPRRQAVARAVSEITVPIIGSTITPVVVFLPLALLTGVTGVFFRSLALTMAVALLTSLVLALSFTPVLAQFFVKVKPRETQSTEEQHAISDSEPAEKKENERDLSARQRELIATEREEEAQMGGWLRAIVRRYEWLLGKALDRRLLVLAVCAGVLVLSFLIYRGLGSEFLPEFDEGAFVLDYFTPPGTSLAETDRILKHVERMLQENKDVESYSRRTGLQLGLSITEPNTGDFLVKLKDNREHKTEDIKDDLRKEIANTEPSMSHVELPGILGDLIGDLTGSPQPIEIKLFSEDTTALRQKAKEVGEVLEKMGKSDTPGIVDVD